MKTEHVFFHLYTDPQFRNATFEECASRNIMMESTDRVIRVEIADDGDGAGEYIRKAEFVTRESLHAETIANARAINAMVADAHGEIEG